MFRGGIKPILGLYPKPSCVWQEGTFMKPGHLEHPNCAAIKRTLQLVGDKWTVLVVSRIGGRTMRFNELRRELDSISQKMLTSTLRNLEENGFVTRTVYPTIPPRVDYALTDMGRDLLGPIQALVRWAVDNREHMERAKAAHALRQAAE